MSQDFTSLQDFIPMQEIAESIYELLSKINSLSIKDSNDKVTYEYLKRKIKSQAFCMQGVTEDPKFKNSLPFQNLRNCMNLKVNDEETHPWVKCTIQSIIPIFDGEISIDDLITFNDSQPLSSALIKLRASIDYIDERFYLAESDPISYIRSCKIPLFTEEEILRLI